MLEVMIDLETYSVEPNAVILTIGAIKFSRTGSVQAKKKLSTFYRRITLKSCKDVGLHTNPETVEWWSAQEKTAMYEAIGNPDRIPLKQALEEFNNWFRGSYIVWANSPSFDCVILESAAKACGSKIPWKFWNTRDCRTLFDLGNVRIKDLPIGIAHNAEDDCYRQIIGVKRALKNLGL
jgi:hypothetical protein